MEFENNSQLGNEAQKDFENFTELEPMCNNAPDTDE